MNGSNDNVSLEIAHDPLTVDYSSYDVALFMGFDEAASLARRKKPSILTGVVEPRAGQNNRFLNVDFLVVNSIEAKDFFSEFGSEIVVYYTYPMVPGKLECPIKKKGIVLGFHGNVHHLESMHPRITRAIAELARETPVELWAMYDVAKYGKWLRWTRKDVGFPVVHIQHTEENYARYIAHADVGLVPQLAPVSENKALRYLIGSHDGRFNERSDNYILRFKETTNIGRHLVFAQYGIPVVSDMTPSACAFIDDEKNSFMAFHTAGWYRALRALTIKRELRVSMGHGLKEKFENCASHEVLNAKLASFLLDRVRERGS